MAASDHTVFETSTLKAPANGQSYRPIMSSGSLLSQKHKSFDADDVCVAVRSTVHGIVRRYIYQRR